MSEFFFTTRNKIVCGYLKNSELRCSKQLKIRMDQLSVTCGTSPVGGMLLALLPATCTRPKCRRMYRKSLCIATA